MQYKFILTGLKPAYGHDVNKFVKACDLGVEGAFVTTSELVTVTTKDERDADALVVLEGHIRQAYESAGWRNVVVASVDLVEEE